MSGLFSKPKPQVVYQPAPVAPPPAAAAPAAAAPPPPPTRSAEEVQAEALAERKRRADAVGRSATILTGPRGVEEDTPSVKKTLLGQ